MNINIKEIQKDINWLLDGYRTQKDIENFIEKYQLFIPTSIKSLIGIIGHLAKVYKLNIFYNKKGTIIVTKIK